VLSGYPKQSHWGKRFSRQAVFLKSLALRIGSGGLTRKCVHFFPLAVENLLFLRRIIQMLSALQTRAIVALSTAYGMSGIPIGGIPTITSAVMKCLSS
jgi:hypothetical protein